MSRRGSRALASLWSHQIHVHAIVKHGTVITSEEFADAGLLVQPNLYIGTTRKYFKYHKLIGRIYLIGGALGAIAAMVITSSPAHKAAGITLTSTSISLLTLGSAWLLAAAMAYRAARNRRYDSHREWMIRSYVLVWSFVFCRLASRVPGVEDMGGGQAFIWLSWVGPLIVGEVALQWRSGASSSSKSKPVPVTP